MIILFRLFSIISLFIFILILFSYFSAIIVYSELISNTSNNYSILDFKDNNLKYRNFDLGLELNYLDWNISYEFPDVVMFSPMDKNNTTLTNSFTSGFIISAYALSTDNTSLEDETNITISFYSNLHSNFTLLDRNDTDWLTPPQQQDQPSTMINYSYIDSYDNIVVNITEIITIYNDRVYSFLFSEKEPFYTNNLVNIKHITKSIDLFDKKRYEKVFDGFSGGFIFKYPNTSEWNIYEISKNKFEFLDDKTTSNKLTLSYFPSSNLTDLTKEILENLTKKNLYHSKKDIPKSDFYTNIGNYSEGGYLNIVSNVTNNIEGSHQKISQMLMYTVYNKTAYVFNHTINDYDNNIYDHKYIKELISSYLFEIIEFPDYSYKNKTLHGISLSLPLHWEVFLNNTTIERKQTEDGLYFALDFYACILLRIF